MKSLFLGAGLLAVSTACGHGLPLTVTTTDGGTRLAPEFVPLGLLEDDGAEVRTFDPGVGVNFAVSGPPAGTVLELEIARGLLYWDGAALGEPDEVLTVKTGQPDTSAVDEYAVSATSGAQSGMTWATYPGGDFWDSHGVFLLEPESPGGSASPGLYGLPLRLASPTLTASEPFVLPFQYGPMASADVQAGIAAFSAALAAPLPGDLDGNGEVDGGDYAWWAANYGDAFDAVDYVAWREAAEASPSASIPEATTASLLASAALPIAIATRSPRSSSPFVGRPGSRSTQRGRGGAPGTRFVTPPQHSPSRGGSFAPASADG